MTRHPTARRVHRQEESPDDVFVAGVLETSAWAKKNSRLLVIGGIVAAVVIIGLIYFVTNRRAEHAQAATQLTQVRAVALSGNNQLAIRELEQFLSRFGGTPSADEARLMLGSAYLQVGQPVQAQDAVAPIADNVRSGLGMNAALLMATAFETAQEPHRAEEIFLRLADDARFLFQRQDALDNAARIRLQRGDVAGAVEIYERLLDMTPESASERPIFEMRLGEVRALEAIDGNVSGAAPPAAPPLAPATPELQEPPAGTAPNEQPVQPPEPTTTGQ